MEILRDAVKAALRDGRNDLSLAPGNLTVSVHGSCVFVGPYRAPNQRGCLECALLWWHDVAPHTAPTASDSSVTGPIDWSEAVGALVAQAVAAASSWTRKISVLDRVTGAVTTHSFVPHPNCANCAIEVETARRPDLWTPQPTTAGFMRTRRYGREELRRLLLDARFGPVAHTYRDEESPLALVTCETIVPGHSTREGGYGRSTNFVASETPAFLEGIERVLGGYRDPATPVMHASWWELGSEAIDLSSLGTHDAELARHPAFAFDPLDPESKTSWVAAHAIGSDRALFVPEHIAYWHEAGTGARFFYESSNGCAVGGSYEEAILHGLCEVIERDAFLLAWYSRSRLVEIDLEGDGEFAHVIDLLRERGLTLRVLDLTSDFEVPTVLAMVTAGRELVASGHAPALSLASGSSLDPAKAIQTAIEECVTNALMYPKWVGMRAEVAIERCRPMLDDFALVRTLEDHTGLHGLWEARPLWAFLAVPSGHMPEAEFRARQGMPTRDVSETLRLLTEHIAQLGMDVVVVDQSAASFTEALGLHAVKVLVPGSVPMTFGHIHQRTGGLPRLAQASTLLRGATPWNNNTTLNPAPHPFP